MRRRVTFSRNVTLSLSRTCRCFCKYCAFATHRPHLHAPDEVTRAARRRRAPARQGAARAHRRGARPSPRRARAPAASGASRTSSPTSCGPASGRSSAGCCRTPTSASSSRDDLARLREVTASQGLMLESVNPDLVAHQGSPTKHPEQRLADDPRRRRAADPVHERHPRRHRRVRGRPDGLARGARRRARRARPPAGGHPPELRAAPPLLRRGARRDRHGGGRALLAHGPVRRAAPRPARVGDADRRSRT